MLPQIRQGSTAGCLSSTIESTKELVGPVIDYKGEKQSVTYSIANSLSHLPRKAKQAVYYGCDTESQRREPECIDRALQRALVGERELQSGRCYCGEESRESQEVGGQLLLRRADIRDALNSFF